jgi:hypothetical protein
MRIQRSVRLGSLITATVLAGFGLTSVTASASPAAIRPALMPPQFSLISAPQSLTSSTGKALTLAFTATNAATMSVTLGRTGALESHTWNFALGAISDLTFDSETGLGALRTGTSLGKFGTMNLNLAAVGKLQSVGCGRTRTSVQPVSVTGTLTYRSQSTGAAKWGLVGGTKKLTFTGQNIISIPDGADKLCGSTLPPCSTFVHWGAHNIVSNGFTQLLGSNSTTNGVTTSTITAQRSTTLASPAGTVRTDTTTIAVPAPAFTLSGASATVKVSPSGTSVTGSATLTSTTVNQMPGLACGAPGQLSADTAWLATYQNGAQPLTIHEEIDGNFVLPNIAGENSATNATIDHTVIE